MTNVEKIELNLIGKWWTRQDEIIEEIETLGYAVTEINNEYVVIEDNADDEAYILYLGHANNTTWVEKVREM